MTANLTVSCVIALSGDAFTLDVVSTGGGSTTTPRPMTGHDLFDALTRRFLSTAASASPVTTGGQHLNIMRSLAKIPLGENDALQNNEKEIYFIFFDQKMLPKFASAFSTSSSEKQKQEYLVQAAELLLIPMTQYLSALTTEFDAYALLHSQVKKSLSSLEEELPNLQAQLQNVKLLEDPAKSLWDMVDIAKRNKIAQDSLKQVEDELLAAALPENIFKLKQRVGDIERKQLEAAARLNAVSSSGSPKSSGSAMIMERMAEVKLVLRDIDDLRRRVVQKNRERLKVIHRGLVSRLEMWRSLPEGYLAASSLAQRRLFLHRATKRLLHGFAPEENEIAQLVEDFKLEWGKRFPGNLFPGITNLPVVGGVAHPDPCALLLDPHVHDIEEDHTSELLEKLHLMMATTNTNPKDEDDEDAKNKILLLQQQNEEIEQRYRAEVELLQKKLLEMEESLKQNTEELQGENVLLARHNEDILENCEMQIAERDGIIASLRSVMKDSETKTEDLQKSLNLLQSEKSESFIKEEEKEDQLKAPS